MSIWELLITGLITMPLWGTPGAIACAIIAKHRGRDPLIWFFIGMVGSLLSVIALLSIPNLAEERRRQQAEWVERRDKIAAEAARRFDEAHGLTKTCPRCAETVKGAALACRFCGHEFTVDTQPTAEPAKTSATG